MIATSSLLPSNWKGIDDLRPDCTFIKDLTSASKYGNSSCSRLPTTCQHFPNILTENDLLTSASKGNLHAVACQRPAIVSLSYRQRMDNFRLVHSCNALTSASKYGNSSCSRLPTTGHRFPVILAILATLNALSP